MAVPGRSFVRHCAYRLPRGNLFGVHLSCVYPQSFKVNKVCADFTKHSSK
jgi:hypothetical protein